MASGERLYPYCLKPLEKTAIWGGDALLKRYGKQAEATALTAESWECWDANAVENGTFAGTSLAQLRGLLGADLMGPLDTTGTFPILTKIIDARLALSVQVHPNDEYAQRVEHQANGKTECWYILAARPGAELVLGWTHDTNRDEFERRVADGSLGDILRHVPVQAGETYYLPAGTMHAIGAGIELFEVQQASDLTYRIFDWNRLDSNGKSRELHVAKAGDVVDYGATTRSVVEPVSFMSGALVRTLLVADSHFEFEHIRVLGDDGTIATNGVPLTITALANPLDVEIAGSRVQLAAYATIVVPAAARELVVRSTGEMLVVRALAQPAVTREDALRGGLSAADIDAYYTQFV